MSEDNAAMWVGYALASLAFSIALGILTLIYKGVFG
jgi:hypothetical protein